MLKYILVALFFFPHLSKSWTITSVWVYLISAASRLILPTFFFPLKIKTWCNFKKQYMIMKWHLLSVLSPNIWWRKGHLLFNYSQSFFSFGCVCGREKSGNGQFVLWRQQKKLFASSLSLFCSWVQKTAAFLKGVIGCFSCPDLRSAWTFPLF